MANLDPKGPGLAALAPNGLLGRVVYDLKGKIRSLKPSSGIAEKVHSVANSIRPGVETRVVSGQEPKGKRAGAKNRHPKGFAGDFDFYQDGKRITDEGFLKDLATKMAAKYNANIGYDARPGKYMGIGRIHIDTMPLDKFGGGAQWGATARAWAKDLVTARKTGTWKAADTRGILPDTMPAPPTRSAAIAQAEQQANIARAYRDPMRALDTVQNARPAIASAPRGAVERAQPVYDIGNEYVRNGYTRQYADRFPAEPAAPVARPAPSPQVAERNYPTLGTRPSLAPTPGSRLAATPAERLAPVPGSRVSPVQGGPTVTGVDITPAQNLAAQYAQYRSPTNYAAVKAALANAPQQTPQEVPPPLTNIPGLAVKGPRLQPTLAMPDPARFAPEIAVPQAYTAGDIYGGQVGSALDNTGQNTVSRDAFGNTSVENQYGATTSMTPGGYQAANFGSGAMPEAPSRFGGLARRGAGTMAGGAVGSLAGPIGSVLGALIGRELAKPGGGVVGGFLNGTRNIDTSKVNVPGIGPNTAFAKAQRGLAFPDVPTGTGIRDPRETNRSRADMDKISERAARDISRGRAGLF